MKLTHFTLLLLLAASLCAGQALPPAGVGSSPMEALQALETAVDAKESEVERLRSALEAARTDVERDRLATELARQVEEFETLQRRFEESATGIDLSPFTEEEKEPFSWQATLGKIVEPIIEEMEAATARSRKRADLKKTIDQQTERQQLSETAIRNLGQRMAATEDPELRAALARLEEEWQQRELIARNQVNAARSQLQALEEEGGGGLGGAGPYIRQFLSQRGLNLIYGIGSAILVFVGLRLILVFIQRLRRGESPNSFTSRIFILFTNLLSVIGAIAALLIVFSAAGDLFLLGLVLVFLIGAAWAGIQVIPQFIESLKIILNIGMVREGQRIVFDGIPWNVEDLGFACRLVNPELDDGQQVLPARRLVGLHSRPWCENEEPFPMRRGEWVRLSDGRTGRSVQQNPGIVTLEELGGALLTYPTATFLDLHPCNLSRQSFRVQTRFGIDYAHQAIATTQVVDWFTKHLETHLPEVAGPENIIAVAVQFAGAGASSLDYEIEVDLKGEAAPLHERVEFALQRLLVDACNAHDLTIPFTQITVHQAG